MRITPAGIALIREFEGCSLTAYQDQGGKWSIGYGCTFGVTPGQTISQDEADAWLMKELALVEQTVLTCVQNVTLSDNQLSALVSFCYNVGFGHFGHKDGFFTLKSGGHSTMLNKLLAGDYDGASMEFPKWDEIAGKFSAGILRRRVAEQVLFLQPDHNCGAI